MSIRTLTRTQIYINSDTLENAKKIARLKSKNLSQLIRESLEKTILENEDLIRSNPKPLKPIKILTIKNRGITNIAQNHNDIYDF